MTLPTIRLALIGAIAVSAAASAQLPRPPAAAAPTPAPAAGGAPGVSAQGNAVIAKVQSQAQADPAIAAIGQKLRAILPQISATATAPTVDVEKFAGLLKQQQALTQQIDGKRLDLMITILRQLPAGDRSAFLRAIANRPPGQGGQAAR